MQTVLFFFWLFVAVTFYTYLGYPALLLILSRWKGTSSCVIASYTRSVSLVIAAHNEENVIARKLDNSLSLDYPMDRLQIIVASNGSTDRTDEIVRSYESKRVILMSIDEPGKTIAQNAAFARATGEIVVFTDADAMFERQTLKNLVAGFGDAGVGLVHGDSRLLDSDEAVVGKNVGNYLRYEYNLKQWESAIGYCMTSYGGIVAVRRDLLEPMDASWMEDFVLPVIVVAKGYKAMFEPTAVMYEKAPQTVSDEFMVTRRNANWDSRAFCEIVPRLLKPVRFLPLVFLCSHKVLRWAVPFSQLGLLFVTLPLSGIGFYRWVLVVQLLFYLLAFAGYLFDRKWRGPRFLFVPFHLCLVNAAALVGTIAMLFGRRQRTWPRAESSR